MNPDPVPEKKGPRGPGQRSGDHRVALVGAGAIARDHVAALADVPRMRLAHVVDRHPERAAALAALVEGATWSTDPATAWSEGIDVTAVCTSPESHADLSVAALGAGKAVLLEKPAALGVADVDRILSAAKSAGRPLLVAQTARFQPVHLEIAQAVADGAVGTPRLAHLTWYTGHVWPGGWRGWQLDPARSGGHVAHNGVHALDLLTWLMDDEPVRVFARPCRTWAPGMPTPDSFQILVRFAGGALATVELCYALAARGTFVRRLMLSGTAGTLHHSSEDEPRAHAASPVAPASIDGAMTEQTRHLRDVLDGSAAPLTAPHQIRAALAAALAAQLSADEGRPVDVKEVC
ncbi:Gfo/Idh/MocA family oxidoreductase [Streptomyces sp. SID8358]|uniref:Gfo/Idh/MocA family protein n=1 Tax=Streptomyces sp. SID8358 TaxID=2690342 RepID=UPI000DAC9336|nr:Gfo/Idh/MocA family oxidoreductase [Streptomyces sp. SID8358]MYU35567.1 Gfo/Idh/MocA family oxidoreductase [Streptomyces sp. SID8358]